MTDYPQNSFNPQPPKSNTSRIILIVVIVLVVLCCCCAVVGYVGWTYGDQIMKSLGASY